MSWSVSMTGKPENVVAALREESNKLTGTSKQEFDDALPHLVGLIEQNVGGGAIELDANGSASFKDGVKSYSSLQAKLSGCSRRVV